jgi:hypothetical protein
MALGGIMIKKSLSIGDLHYPHHIDLQPFFDYGQYLKPEYVNLMGDMIDLDLISHHNETEFKNVGFDNIKNDFQLLVSQFTGVLDAFRMAFPKAIITFVPGNHEEWLCRFATDYPQLDKKIDRSSSMNTLRSLFDMDKMGINTINFGETLNIGKLYFRHGHEYGTMFPAKQAVLHSHKNIAIWHHHTRQCYTSYSDVDEVEFIGFSVPCYCTKGMKYGRGKPNRWSNGFLWACHKESGNFTAGIISTSKKGHFIVPNGEEYT